MPLLVSAVPAAGTVRYSPDMDAPAPPDVEVTTERPYAVASVTIDPIRLSRPLFEIQAELGLFQRAGVSVIAGAGQIRGLPAGELGGQLRAYPLGTFSGGALVALEVLYLEVEPDPSLSWTGGSLSVGGVVGGKHVYANGFTIEGQIGWARLFADGEPNRGVIVQNIGIGWSLF